MMDQTRLRAMGRLSDDEWKQFNQIVQRGLEIIEGKDEANNLLAGGASVNWDRFKARR